MKSSKPSKEVVFDLSAIQAKIISDINKPLKTLEDLERYFRVWWCRHYNKPYKCPEVDSYILEELICEYFDVFYRDNPDEVKKFLSKEVVEEAEDEKWLKEQMGQEYISIEEQERLLSKEKVDEQIKEKQKEEFKINFDIDEFK